MARFIGSTSFFTVGQRQIDIHLADNPGHPAQPRRLVQSCFIPGQAFLSVEELLVEDGEQPHWADVAAANFIVVHDLGFIFQPVLPPPPPWCSSRSSRPRRCTRVYSTLPLKVPHHTRSSHPRRPRLHIYPTSSATPKCGDGPGPQPAPSSIQ